MKTRVFLMAGVMIAQFASPSFAIESQLSKLRSGYIQTVSCNVNDSDKQAMCMQGCDDEWIKATQAYNSNIDQAKVTKKACEVKCGC